MRAWPTGTLPSSRRSFRRSEPSHDSPRRCIQRGHPRARPVIKRYPSIQALRAIDGLHQAAEWLLLALIVVHVGAALLHIFVYRDHIMQRMLPGQPTV